MSTTEILIEAREYLLAGNFAQPGMLFDYDGDVIVGACLLGALDLASGARADRRARTLAARALIEQVILDFGWDASDEDNQGIIPAFYDTASNERVLRALDAAIERAPVPGLHRRSALRRRRDREARRKASTMLAECLSRRSHARTMEPALA